MLLLVLTLTLWRGGGGAFSGWNCIHYFCFDMASSQYHNVLVYSDGSIFLVQNYIIFIEAEFTNEL